MCGYCGFLARPGEIITNENGEPLVALVGTDISSGQKQRELCTALVEGAIAFAVSETLGLIAALSLLTSRMALGLITYQGCQPSAVMGNKDRKLVNNRRLLQQLGQRPRVLPAADCARCRPE